VLYKQEEEVLKTTYIRKLLNNTNANIAYTTNNTIRKHPKQRRRNHDLYFCNYKEWCPVCPIIYIGINGRCFSLDLRNTATLLRQIQGIQKFLTTLEENHFFTSMENVMKIIS
jgi:hypothetical protein